MRFYDITSWIGVSILCSSFSHLCYASLLMKWSNYAFEIISLCFHYASIVKQLLTQNSEENESLFVELYIADFTVIK